MRLVALTVLVCYDCGWCFTLGTAFLCSLLTHGMAEKEEDEKEKRKENLQCLLYVSSLPPWCACMGACMLREREIQFGGGSGGGGGVT